MVKYAVALSLMSTPDLDLDFVRAQFPAFQDPALDGKAFFENAGGSFPCKQVIERLERFYRSRKVQPYEAYAPSNIAGEEMDEAQNRLSAMLNIEADELSFGPSTTQNTYVLAQAFRQMMSPGDAIIVTNQDHEANSGPWRRLAEDGIEIREWQVDPATGNLGQAALEALLDDRVKLVCFPHCSNILGRVNPVAAWCQTIRDAGAYSCVDGVSHAPHGFPDIAALGADIYMFSSYKTYGPHQGILSVRRDLADRLPNQGHVFNAGSRSKRFTPAGPDHAQVAACAGMVDFVESIHDRHFGGQVHPAQKARFVNDLFKAQEQATLAPLLAYLSGRNDVRLLGETDARLKVPTVAVNLMRDPRPVAKRLAELGIMAGAGDFYAVRVLGAMGVDPDQGVLRLSFVHYTSHEDVKKLLNALDLVL